MYSINRFDIYQNSIRIFVSFIEWFNARNAERNLLHPLPFRQRLQSVGGPLFD